jgi:hypothetical protein
MKLGSFGAAIRELDPGSERDTFDFFGETFTVEGVIPSILALQLGAALAGKIAEVDGNAAIWQALRCALSKPVPQDADAATRSQAEDQFDRWYMLAIERRCDLDELLKLALTLHGAQAGRPTVQRPTSSDGSLPTSTPSNSPASDTPASPDLRPVDEALAG